MQSRNLMLIAIGTIATAIMSVGCSSTESRDKIDVKSFGLNSESDSLSYVIGINIAEQMLKMDSLINVEVACRAIIEHSKGEGLMNIDDARANYLRYLLYVEPERRRGYEEQFLSDLVANDRSFKRTKSGLAYTIETIGDESKSPRSTNDWVEIKYSISRVGGDVVATDITAEEALSDFAKGLSESVKMLGVGGRIKVWIPSKLAYGEEGDKELGINPIETLLFDIEVVNVERNGATKHKIERELKEF